VAGYSLVIAPRIADRIRHLPPDLKRGIREAMRAITEDPAKGEPLKRELQEYRKYKVRRYRIVYQLDRGSRKITIMSVGHRRSVYEDAAAAIRLRSGG
jgi:mRNA interferase RelE/StbE